MEDYSTFDFKAQSSVTARQWVEKIHVFFGVCKDKQVTAVVDVNEKAYLLRKVTSGHKKRGSIQFGDSESFPYARKGVLLKKRKIGRGLSNPFQKRYFILDSENLRCTPKDSKFFSF